jgi:hypothetical protein
VEHIERSGAGLVRQQQGDEQKDECDREGRGPLVTAARGRALSERQQHSDAELENGGVTSAESHGFADAGPRRPYDRVRERKGSGTVDDGFAVAMSFARRLPSGSVRFEQEPPKWIYGERELKDQIAKRVEGTNMLGLMTERAR